MTIRQITHAESTNLGRGSRVALLIAGVDDDTVVEHCTVSRVVYANTHRAYKRESLTSVPRVWIVRPCGAILNTYALDLYIDD